ncbi:DUF3180 family protein [Nigerium massiliense]|uniref:DUF3180 family protein n=1 Tax=Nigerium massiliense TaxID=1522317 RepID=UPI0006948C56|nr:DUF3180 family protein [Nigerium massiliense]
MSDPTGKPEPGGPVIEPTTPSWVAIAAALGAGATYLVLDGLRRAGQSLPRVEAISWASVAIIAAGITYLAVSTGRLVRERRADLDNLAAVNRLLLGKGSLLGGAGLGGAYVTLVLMSLSGWPAPLAQDRVIHGSIAVALCVWWAVAGWFLERACRVPRDPDDTPEDEIEGGDTRRSEPGGDGPPLS